MTMGTNATIICIVFVLRVRTKMHNTATTNSTQIQHKFNNATQAVSCFSVQQKRAGLRCNQQTPNKITNTIIVVNETKRINQTINQSINPGLNQTTIEP
mmetsp:Transcript_6604/g.16468  ORF Transcript_6604/g.16468 Transcript_6604/m.16468 type:complete len:99 (+) Transcript_6604:962-1258(+)